MPYEHGNGEGIYAEPDESIRYLACISRPYEETPGKMDDMSVAGRPTWDHDDEEGGYSRIRDRPFDDNNASVKLSQNPIGNDIIDGMGTNQNMQQETSSGNDNDEVVMIYNELYSSSR